MRVASGRQVRRGGGSRFPAYLDQAWYLTADIGCWTGLMPHIHGVEVIDRRGDRTLARIDARFGWLPVEFECGFAHDQERLVMHRWYRGALWGGIVETWRLRQEPGGLVSLSYTVIAETWWKRLLATLIIASIARKQNEMIDLLAVAHRRANDSDGW